MRKEGYYWIKRTEGMEWECARWVNGEWLVPGINAGMPDGRFLKVEYRIPDPACDGEAASETPFARDTELALCDMVGQYCSEGESEDGATIVGEPMDQASAAAIEALVGLGYLTPREVVGFQFTSKAGVWGPKA